MATYDDVDFRIGSIQFRDREIPGGLGDVGGRQMVVVHDFAGGQRTAQLFGAFAEDKEWEGELFGRDAIQRAHELEQLYLNPQGVTLIYASWKWLVVVLNFKLLVEHQYYIKYTCKVRVIQDNSGNASAPSTVPTTENLLMQAQNVANQQVQVPVLSNYSFATPVSNAVALLQSTINSSMTLASGLLGNLTAPQVQSIQAQITSVTSLLAPLATGSNQAAASSARDLLATILLMNNIFASISPTLTTITQNSPNLFRLAALYYGDASLWGVIAQANNIADPQPTGTYTLSIPVRPLAAQPNPNLFI